VPAPSLIAVVTGANRGLGLETSRQLAELGHTVILGSRDLAKGERAAARLAGEGIEVTPVELDVTDATTLSTLAERLDTEYGHIDAIINNAAIHYDSWQRALAVDFDVVHTAFETNVIGAWQTTLVLLPLLRRSEHGRIVNVSSGAGALTDMSGGAPGYKVSKTSLNALTRMWTAELAGERILVKSVCPGWVATDMGGPGGRPVTEGAAGIVWAATLPDDGPTGGFFRDGQPIPW
jgi:NAD(P)-dependent dehydrogenase (short-subunit alcohol dehydrogenase family)